VSFVLALNLSPPFFHCDFLAGFAIEKTGRKASCITNFNDESRAVFLVQIDIWATMLQAFKALHARIGGETVGLSADTPMQICQMDL
jgi:hypothetical protein